MAFRKVEITLGPTGAKGSVKIDGEEIQNCRALDVKSSVDGITSVTLELIKVEVSLVGSVHESMLETRWFDVTAITDEHRRYKKTRGLASDEKSIDVDQIIAAQTAKRLAVGK